jgi:hypothetical protein
LESQGEPLEPPAHYAGRTSQGEPISFDVLPDGSAVTNFLLAFDAVWLQPVQLGITEAPIAITGLFPISDDGRFRETVRAQHTTVVLEGSLDASGTATGSLHVDAVIVHRGMPRRCTTGEVGWTAQLVASAY